MKLIISFHELQLEYIFSSDSWAILGIPAVPDVKSKQAIWFISYSIFLDGAHPPILGDNSSIGTIEISPWGKPDDFLQLVMN